MVSDSPTLGRSSNYIMNNESTSILFSTINKGHTHYRDIRLSLSKVVIEDSWLV